MRFFEAEMVQHWIQISQDLFIALVPELTHAQTRTLEVQWGERFKGPWRDLDRIVFIDSCSAFSPAAKPHSGGVLHHLQRWSIRRLAV